MTPPRILGVDYGEKRVGTALSDPLGLTAQPLGALAREDDGQLIGALEELVRAHGVGRIVVGIPVGLGGGDSARARRTRRFVTRLKAAVAVPVDRWDERLSTAEADRTLREMEVRPSRRKGRRDVIAAQLILQAYLDRHSLADLPRLAGRHRLAGAGEKPGSGRKRGAGEDR